MNKFTLNHLHLCALEKTRQLRKRQVDKHSHLIHLPPSQIASGFRTHVCAGIHSHTDVQHCSWYSQLQLRKPSSTEGNLLSRFHYRRLLRDWAQWENITFSIKTCFLQQNIRIGPTFPAPQPWKGNHSPWEVVLLPSIPWLCATCPAEYIHREMLLPVVGGLLFTVMTSLQSMFWNLAFRSSKDLEIRVQERPRHTQGRPGLNAETLPFLHHSQFDL